VIKLFLTDTELLEGLAQGKREAVTAIYKQYQNVLVKWIVTRGGAEADAEDIFQEALVVVYEKAKQPEFCLTCKLGTYLFAISKKLWYKKIESKNILSTLDDEDEERNASTYDNDLHVFHEQEAKFTQLDKALQRLGEPCSSLLKAFYEEQKNMQEIAEAFKYTNAENAKTQKYKCLARLRKIFFTTEVSTIKNNF
jgi:RNA polymerase sigma factor (sigma-70 family)